MVKRRSKRNSENEHESIFSPPESAKRLYYTGLYSMKCNMCDDLEMLDMTFSHDMSTDIESDISMPWQLLPLTCLLSRCFMTASALSDSIPS